MEKDALRARLRTKRAALSAAFRRLSSESIAQNVLRLPDWETVKTIGLYAALDAPHFEVQTGALHDVLLGRGYALAYPRVRGDSLQFAQVTDRHTDMTPGPWNIAEPNADCPIVPVEDIDLLIVPGVAFTASGSRLGQGGGYYDRLLSSGGFSGRSVGLSFQAFVLTELPLDPWDQAVEWLATEHELLAVTRSK